MVVVGVGLVVGGGVEVVVAGVLVGVLGTQWIFAAYGLTPLKWVTVLGCGALCVLYVRHGRSGAAVGRRRRPRVGSARRASPRRAGPTSP